MHAEPSNPVPVFDPRRAAWAPAGLFRARRAAALPPDPEDNLRYAVTAARILRSFAASAMSGCRMAATHRFVAFLQQTSKDGGRTCIMGCSVVSAC